ncbi:serine hydrolase domain-containing protein [Nonomuraea sp. NPDC003804]|uniref:serine hydrolase domain-containing protein n=1 Tax=Nonomuraea sp. NPDC003804 TaxID=3154547 RepID=UPI0033A0F4BA
MTDLDGLVRESAERLAAKHVGVVVAALTPGSVEIRGAGRAGGDNDGPPGAETVFEVGSVTKVFTALTLARLGVAGTVDLDEPVAALLPEGARVPSRDGQEITLRHLAAHTSGLPRLPKGMMLEALLRPWKPDPYAGCTIDLLLRGLARTRLGATPGRRFRYSNLGAGLLGAALAHRAGTDYETLISREISSPLDLTGTGITVEGAVGSGRSARLAQGHTRRGRPAAAWHLADMAGAGGLRSTPADLVAFLRAHVDDGAGALAEAIRLSRRTEHRISPFSWVHLGWMGQRLHARQGAHLQLWHSGMTGGFSSFVGFDPEKGVGVAVLSNTRRSVDRPAFELLRTLQTARS